MYSDQPAWQKRVKFSDGDWHLVSPFDRPIASNWYAVHTGCANESKGQGPGCTLKGITKCYKCSSLVPDGMVGLLAMLRDGKLEL